MRTLVSNLTISLPLFKTSYYVKCYIVLVFPSFHLLKVNFCIIVMRNPCIPVQFEEYGLKAKTYY